MKHILLLILVGISLISFGQNAPVAVDDTLTFRYDFIQQNDSFIIFTHTLLLNDSDLDGDSVLVDSVLTPNLGQVEALNYQGSVFSIKYFPPLNFGGADSFKYVIRDNGNPVRFDTGVVTIVIQYPTYQSLDANNILARIDKDVLFSNQADGSGFEVPKGSNTHSIFASNLWVAGKNNGDYFSNVRMFGDSSYTGDESSNCGPVNNLTYPNSEYSGKWDRVWKVKQYEIDYHLANWNSPNYDPPASIKEWPAHGDPNNGEALDLAPFVDVDNDGKYNPLNGDYPVIKGDQAVYFIYNDGGSYWSKKPMKTEVHGMAYAFQCEDSALQNTIFVDYRIINRSNITYDSTYFGMWADIDLGNPNDDYIQCDVDRSLYFFLNGDDFDDDSNGRPGYGNHIPAQGVMTLKGAKQDNDGQDNSFGIGLSETINGTGFGDGISDNEYWGMEYFSYLLNNINGVLKSEIEYYSFLSGTDTLGNPWASDFLNTGTPIPFKFVFPGSSDSYNYGTGGIAVPPWTDLSTGNTPADRRGVSSTGPVTFAPGDEIELTYAFVFGRDYINTGAQAGVINMLERADSIRSYFDQGMLSACGFPVSVQNPINVKSNLTIYPNPTHDIINIRQEKAESITIEILDITGKVLLTTSGKNQLTTVDLSGFVNGVYLVKVSADNGVKVQKFIKN